MKCLKCGKLVQGAHRYCPACGFAVEPEPLSLWAIKFAAAVQVAVGVVVAAFFAFAAPTIPGVSGAMWVFVAFVLLFQLAVPAALLYAFALLVNEVRSVRAKIAPAEEPTAHNSPKGAAEPAAEPHVRSTSQRTEGQ